MCINQFLSSVSSRVFIVCPFPPHAPHTQVPRYSVAFFPHGKTMAMLNKLWVMKLRILIPSAFALPANEVHDHFLLAHHFWRTIRHVKINDVQSLNVVSMAYLHHLMLMCWSPDYEWKTSSLLIWGGLFRIIILCPNITKKVFHLLWWKIHFLSFVSNFALRLLEFFHTKPIILISWYYLWVQISDAAQLLSVFCKFQLPCLDHFFLHSRLLATFEISVWL